MPERAPTPRATRLSRSARYGTNAVVLSIATIGIVVLLNLLAARYYKRFDVTQARLHSLSPQSLQVLQDLEGPIEVIGFYPDGQNQRAFERWLDEYQAHTDAIDYRTIDPIRQPGETERLGWDIYGGGLLVRRGDRSQQVLYPDEPEITSALLKISRAGPQAVYVLNGHNERAHDDPGGGGYLQLTALLESNNLQARPLNLSVTEAVPGDAALLVLAGPRTPLLPNEERLIRDYMLNGGRALILLDPFPGDDRTVASVNKVIEPWRIRFGNQTIVDPEQSLGGDPLTPALTQYGFHQITKDLANTLIALPLAAPILPPDMSGPNAPGPDELTSYDVLAMTSEVSWGESDLRDEPLHYDEGSDLPGPLAVAVAIESPVLSDSEGNPTRLVLIGDSDLARNDVLDQIPNGQYLLLNAANWLAQEEALIAIGPKTQLAQTIRLSRIQETAVSLAALVLLPAATALAGFVVWYRRRRPRRPQGKRP